MKHFSSFSSIVLLLVLVSACGAMDTMSRMDDSTKKMSNTTEQMNTNTSQMKDSTSDMSSTTKGMAKTTEGMAKNTESMAGTTGKVSSELAFTYLDMRAGNTRQNRQEALQGMASAQDPSAKLAYASEYFAAAEYQYWKSGYESTGNLDDLKNTAVQEFFSKVQEYIQKTRDASPLAKDEKSENLYALAASMHYINLAQINAMKQNPELKLTSMLSMIEEGLSARSKLDAGTVEEVALPSYQVEVLHHEEIALYLLKVRQNYLKAIALAMSSSLKDGTDYSNDPNSEAMKAMTCLKHISLKDGVCTAPIKWTPTYEFRNSTELNYIAGVLKAAAETQYFLKSQSINPENDVPSLLMLSLMKIDASKITSKGSLQALGHISTALAAVLAK